MILKAQFASDWDEKKIKFPCYIQPKSDGVRAINFTGRLTGRSLKEHANRFTTNFFSDPLFIGLDGEMRAAAINHPDLCRLTTSALSRIEGMPEIHWTVFDYITEDTIYLPYGRRLSLLMQKMENMRHPNIQVTDNVYCGSMDDLLHHEETWLDDGYEGVIIRGIDAPHKSGRSTVREGGLLRIKRFIEEEAEVIGIEEGQTNLNVAQKNELGNTFRTSHKENCFPNGMIGNLQCRMLKDVYDPQFKTKLLLAKDQIITVSAGKLSHAERLYYFVNQSEILHKIIKFKFFPKGGKDKPRFPNFQSFKIASDM